MMSALETNFGQTPSQTVGPYFAYGLTATQYGYDFDQPFDAMVEISQPDGEGRYPQTVEEAQQRGFRAFGRCGTGTDAQKRFVFHTVKPGAETPGEAPHINVIVTMRGLLVHAFTRIYFSDEATANAGDAVLLSVPEARRNTLIAERTEQGGAVVYRFDIRMQGADETAFFDV